MDKTSLSKPNRIDDNLKSKKRQKLLAYTANITQANNNNTTEIHNKTALLQISVIQEQSQTDKLTATLALLEQKFNGITILIDMHLAKLTLKVLMPYMKEEQLNNMAEQMKDKWLTSNLHIIGRINIPWSIITSTDSYLQQDENAAKLDELLKNSAEFGHHVTGDAKSLIHYLTSKHNVTDNKRQNTPIAEAYIVDRIAIITAINSLNNIEYAYISYDNMYIYSFLHKNQKIKLPLQYFTLKVTKNDKAALFASKEDINKFSYAAELKGISNQHACLENFAKHFPGHFYIHSSDCKILACNKRQALSFGVRDADHIIGKNFDELFPKQDADKISKTLHEITTNCKAKTILESYDYLGNKCTYLSVKTPLTNKNNKMLGIIGFSLAITDSNDPNEAQKSATINETQTIIQDAAT